MPNNQPDRIVLNQEVHFGKPCVRGTRISVEQVLELVSEGIPFNEIVEEYYPDLTTDDIKACIRYARDLVASEEIHLSHSS